jgi:glycosyltransferase involved in cell wall biosynthesis
LSRDGRDIGSWRAGKFLRLLGFCVKAWWLRLRHGPAVLYYVPAPGKRGALYRDFVVMVLCRPFFRALVLHWHAVGLGGWIKQHTSALERALAVRLLGRADLAVVLAPELAADAATLNPRRTAIVPNSIPDPGFIVSSNPPSGKRACEVLFIGLCSREKGLFDALDAVLAANVRQPGAFSLTVAGEFADPDEESEFRQRTSGVPAERVRYVGFVNATQKAELFRTCDLLCFPTAYPHEGQPLVILEALAFDLPIVTTRWRAIPSLVPRDGVWLVEPRDPDALANALVAARASPRKRGGLRDHYLLHYTPELHLAALRSELLALRMDPGATRTPLPRHSGS